MARRSVETKHMKLRLARAVAALLLSSAFAVARAAAPPSPPVVEYRIEAQLDERTHEVEGKERLVWRNPSDEPVGELRFHLYLNAFKNNRSTFFRETGRAFGRDLADRKANEWGWIDVLSLRTSDSADLARGSRFVAPDGNDATDETVLSVPLPAPVPPRGTIELAIEFRSKLPRIVARTGFVRDFHLVGQWFPKLGVYEPAGMRGRAAGGWNCHAFHANSEFYADYGAFDVTFTVPARFRVGATGRLVSAETRGGQTTYRYVQRDVHDFAWTADPRFLVREFVFDPARDMPRGWTERAAKELGRRPDELALTPVSIRLLLQPDHESALGRYVRSARTALAFYGLWFGAYPYPTLTIVDPPEDGFGAGGMEYPTFVTGGAPSVLLHWPFDRVLLVEDVTVHEIGHQWWYGLVGSNEFEEPWLDEGINSDSEYRALELAYGPRIASLPGGLGFGLRSLGHLEYVVLPNLDPIRRFAWRFSSGRAFGVNSYPKVALFLAQLSNDLGAATFARAERAYFDEWSFRHPSTDDFFAVFERVSGRDLTTYRRNIVEGTARLDWRVVSAATARESEDAGVFERAGKRVTLETGRRFGTGARAAVAGPPSYVSTVLFGNDGEWAHSAAARLVFEDGKVLDRPLSADARWVRLTARYGLPLAWAAVDPDRRNPWDWDRLNDSKVLGGGRGAADVHGTRAAVRSFGWAAYLIALMTQLLWSLA